MHEKDDSVTVISDQRAVSDSGVHPPGAVVDGPLSVKEGEDIWPRDKEHSTQYIPSPLMMELRKENEEYLKANPTISFSLLMSQEFPKARYTLEPFFESGTVNMVSAPPNTWKSWLLFYFAAHIADGSLVLGKFPTEKANVMIVNEEDSFRAIQDRFNLLSITNKDLPIFFRVAQGAKLEKAFIETILEECKEKKITCVMFDSLRSMHEGNENDSTEMQIVLDKLKSLSREGITVIFTHHHRKKSMFSKGDDAEASRGSSAINAAISGHVSLEEEERDSGSFLILRHLKSKAGEKLAPIEIKIEKSMDKIVFVYDGEYKNGEKKLVASKDAIMFALKPGEWKTANDFITLDIASKNVIRAALMDLVREGVLVGMSKSEAMRRKLIPLVPGRGNEKLYTLPSEEIEAVQKQFDDF